MTLAATSYPGFAQSGASSAARAEFDRIIAYINALEAAFINGTVTLLSKNVSGAGTVTLTAEEAGNNIIEFTGALAGAMNVVFPNGPLLVVVQNKTTGDFDLTCKTSAGTGVVVRRGSRVFIYPDGTNVVDVTPKTNSSIPKNLGIGFSVGGNALTIGLKDAGGSDPSVTSPVTIPFRSATLANGTQFDGVVTAALSVTVSSGSTVGSSSGVPQDIFVYALNNAGTVELAFSGADYGNSFIGSSTAEGGAGT